MTVSNTVSRNQYTASSGQTVFPYTFEVFVSSDITVLQNDTTLSEGSNYSVSGVGVDAGGNITLTVGATTGDIITVYRSMELDRTTDYQNSGDFLAQEVNDDFDRLWLAAQQGDENNSRAIVKPVTDSSSINMELPEAATRFNTFLGFDGAGGVRVVPASDPSSPVTNASLVSYVPAGVGAEITDVQTKLRETVSVKDYGAVGDGVTDDTAAIQAAINYAANNYKLYVHFPAQSFVFSKLYLHYDATYNPTYPTATALQGRITLLGSGRGTLGNFNSSLPVGTTLISNDATGPAISCEGDPLVAGTYQTNRVQLQNFSLYVNNTTQAINFRKVAQNSSIEELYINQAGAGGGIQWKEGWIYTLKDIRIDGAGKTISGNGVMCFNVAGELSGGFVDMEQVVVNNFNNGIVLGSTVFGNGARLHSLNLDNCQGGSCTIGIVIGHGVDQATLIGCHAEEDDEGMRVYNGAAQITFLGCSFVNSIVGLQLGTGGSTDADSYNGITVNACKFVHNATSTYGMYIYSAANSEDVTIINSTFTGDVDATDVGLFLEDVNTHHVRVLSNTFGANLTTTIQNPTRIQELHDEKSVQWRTVNTGGTLTEVPFRFRQDSNTGVQPVAEFHQEDGSESFIQLGSTITPGAALNNITTKNTGGVAVGPGDTSWAFSRMIKIRTVDDSGTADFWMPLFTSTGL